MKKVFLVHNIVAPYRLPVFEELSKHCDLIVAYCSQMAFNRLWSTSTDAFSFKKLFLPGLRLPMFVINYSLPVYLLKNKFDYYIVTDNEENALTILYVALVAKLRRKALIVWSGQVEDKVSVRKYNKRGFMFQFVKFLSNSFFAVYRKLLYAATDTFVAYSQASADFLYARGVDPHKTFCGTQIMPKNLLPKASNVKILDRTKVNLLYLGYFRRVKGVELLIKAFQDVNKQNLVLHIVGGGDTEQELKALGQHIPAIHFYDYADNQERANWYAACDLLVFPTLKDPWAHTITESLYYGLPVMTTTAAGASVVVKDGDNGFLIEPNDIEAIKNILLKISTKPSILKKLKTNTIQHLDMQYYEPAYAVKPFIAAIGYADRTVVPSARSYSP